MSNVWIPSDEEYNEMCRRCENSSSNALKMLKMWINNARRSRPVCKETFCPADPKKSRQAPLVLAANSHNAHIVRYLLTEYSSVIDVNCKGDVGQHVVGIYRSPAITHKLHIDFGGVTALWAACRRGNREIAQLLLRAGADVNAVTTEVTINSTPMEISAFNGHTELMELLYSYGADVNMRDGQECSPLMAASIANHTNAVIFLLEHGADVNQKNTKGYTVFHVAAANGSLNVIRVLLRKGFSPSFELPLPDSVPCPYFIAINLGHYEIAEKLKQTHVHTKEYESETLLLRGARFEKTKEWLQSAVLGSLENWRNAIRLRNTCGYMPEFLPPSDLYAGLSEIVTERDLFRPPKHGELDIETWGRYQSLLIKRRIMGPPFMMQALLESGIVMCEKKLFRHAELLWLQFLEYYSEHSVNIFISSEVPHYKTCVRTFALGISKMGMEQYRPNFSKFVRFCFILLSKMKYIDTVTSESILWIFASWIRSEHNIREGDYYSEECEELGRELVSRQFHMNNEITLLQVVVSNFNKNVHILFGAEYQHLVYALLRWGCDQELYSVKGCTHPIHEAVRVGNEYHVDFVTPLLRYGCSPLFVDSKGRTALQLATSDMIIHKLRGCFLSLFSLCCVAIVQYGFPYESLELPNGIKNNIRLFDKRSRCGK